MAKGFFCCVLGWLQLFQLAFVVFLYAILLMRVLLAYLILLILEGIGLGFLSDFVRLDLA